MKVRELPKLLCLPVPIQAMIPTCLLVILSPSFAIAQNQQQDSVRPELSEISDKITESPNWNTLPSKKHELSIWGGFSPDTTNVFKFDSGQDARLGVFGIRFARRYETTRFLHLKYTGDLIPFALFSYPQFSDDNQRLATRRTKYAFGVAPLGIQANFRPKKKVQPFVNNSWGIIIFPEKVPNANGTRLNFIIDYGGGVEIMLNEKKTRALTVGYKVLHISNADRGEFNPGYDNNLFYLGYRFFSY